MGWYVGWRGRRGSSSLFCSVKILGVNNEGKEFLFWQANIRARVFVNIKNRD